MPRISIVILTFNSIEFIESCLGSIFNQDYQDFEIIIVDNGSRDGTSDFIRENYSQVILIENKQNLGTCRARNQGIEASKGKLILTLDCDIILEKNFVRRMMNFIEESGQSVGMIQPKILNMDKKTLYSCGIHLSKLRRFYDIGKGKFNNGQFDKPKYIFGACSAAAFYKKIMLEDVKEKTGYFDERFFFLVEDVDLAWRAQKKGWKALFYPEAVCYHNGNSSQTHKNIRQYYCFRNRLLMINKNENIFGKIKLIPFFIIYDAPRLLYMLFFNPFFNFKRDEIYRRF